MAKYDPEMEARMAKAIAHKRINPHIKTGKLAQLFVVKQKLLQRRLKGRPAQNTKGGHNKVLNSVQDEGLRGYIDYLIYLGHKATFMHIRLGANSILKESGEARTVNTQWASRWFNRNRIWYKTLRAKTLAAERKAAHKKEDLDIHFCEYYTALAKFGISFADIYNMDETGFRVGVLTGRIVITHLDIKAVYLADPDNRESITSIETICADGSTIAPMLVLKGEVLLAKLFANNLEDETVLATSPTGYSNEQLAMCYLKHFHNQTYIKTKGAWRMLVFDGHGSHTSDEYLLYCWQHKIVPFILQPHSTHMLQPLNVGVFQPLKHWHQESIHNTI